jgi:hypothetical protein
MNEEQEQINALPGQWSESGGRSGIRTWELDTSDFGVLRDSVVEVTVDASGQWTAKAHWMGRVHVLRFAATAKTARAAFELLADDLETVGAELVEASHELINGR